MTPADLSRWCRAMRAVVRFDRELTRPQFLGVWIVTVAGARGVGGFFKGLGPSRSLAVAVEQVQQALRATPRRSG